MIITVPLQYDFLSNFIAQQCQQFSSDYNISIAANPLQALSLADVDCVAMPLHNIDFILPTGIVVSALSERSEAATVLAVRKSIAVDDVLLGVPEGAKIAILDEITEIQLKQFFPNHIFEVTLDISLALKDKTCAAIALPKYFIACLDVEDFEIHDLHPREVIPPAGQGAVAFLTRTDDLATRRLLKSTTHHSPTVELTNVERKYARDWYRQGTIAAAYCEKDVYEYYHLHTAHLQQGEILKEKRSFSTLIAV